MFETHYFYGAASILTITRSLTILPTFYWTRWSNTMFERPREFVSCDRSIPFKTYHPISLSVSILLSHSCPGLSRSLLNSLNSNYIYYAFLRFPWMQYSQPTPNLLHFITLISYERQPHLPRGLPSRSQAACLLGLRVRIPPEAWMSVSWGCCVLSGRGHRDGRITRPEETYRVWCILSVIEEYHRGGLDPLRLSRHAKISYEEHNSWVSTFWNLSQPHATPVHKNQVS